MEYILFIIFCFFTIIPLTTLLHELGHYFMTKFYFVDNVTISVGSGKKLIHFKFKSLTFVLRIFPYGGATFFELTSYLSPLKQIWISLGGPLLNGFIAILLFSQVLGNDLDFITLWLQWFALFNLWVCVMNLIPYKIGTFYSDGWVIVKAIREILK